MKTNFSRHVFSLDAIDILKFVETGIGGLLFYNKKNRNFAFRRAPL